MTVAPLQNQSGKNKELPICPGGNVNQTIKGSNCLVVQKSVKEATKL